MEMTSKEIYDRLLECAKTEIENWLKADKLTPIEQTCEYMPVVSGIARSALFLLPNDMYFKWLKEVRDLGGLV